MLRRILEGLGLSRSLPRAVPYTHPRYGHFADDGTGIHEHVKVEWDGRSVFFAPDSLGGVVIEDSFDTMDALLQDTERWNQETRATIIRDCYPLWAENWFDPGAHQHLTENQFADRLILQSICTGEGGSVSFYFDDDEIFGEHAVVAFGTLQGGIEEATMEG
ncbi:DUF2262 domain-containing protein [Paraurantiacibacter namhicola]|uniref:DUF2262 domain-containing protein n=1 Tax=Paraurantiacibacter namhicola TaxID=645517 RepID=A0A1C7DB09_9SPHN|nr:DUF2262 domain-containing protein [Paraurantiacibacter namhicola]ANU08634.1 hypothetical protein A6F65_02351 [Paraurantiacibacter namhicola]